PFLFRAIRALESGEPNPGPPTAKERASTFARHVDLILERIEPKRHATELRKACAWYAKGLPGANGLRQTVWALTDAAGIIHAGRAFCSGLCARVLTPDDDILLMRSAGPT